jgi:hypothetical protein
MKGIGCTSRAECSAALADRRLLRLGKLETIGQRNMRQNHVRTRLPTTQDLAGHLGSDTCHQHEIPRTSQVEVRVLEAEPASDADPTISLLESWIAQAPTEREAIEEAVEDLREFKRNMNLPRKESGARLHYPEAE